MTEGSCPTEFARPAGGTARPATAGALETLRLAAEDVSARAVARPQELLPCAPDQPGGTSCAREFIARFGARAFRRPLADDEQMTLADRRSRPGDRQRASTRALRRVIEVALGSPQFLYRIDLGEPSRAEPA